MSIPSAARNVPPAVRGWWPAAAGILLLLAAAPGAAQDRFAAVTIKATPVAGSVFVLEGAGGNVGVSIGEDGTLIIDDQFAPLAPRIATALGELGGAAPKLVLNTHYHGDHTGGNAYFGTGGTIIAHVNVRDRLLAGGMAAAGLPVLTFEDRLRLYFNGDEVDVIHLPRGHTDGDAVVWFKDSGVIHMGDHFFNARFPFVDVAAGGSVDGLARNIEQVLDMIPAATRVIPGHGTLATVEELKTALAVVRESQATVLAAQAADTLDALKRDGFGRWESWGSGFIDTATWIDIVVASDGAGG